MKLADGIRYWADAALSKWLKSSALEVERLERENAELRQWKDAVLEATVSCCIYRADYESDPVGALNDLIRWETGVALDPAVSTEARALIERGRREASAPTLVSTQDEEEAVLEVLAESDTTHEPGLLRLGLAQ